ncbi:hypothetical protein [Haloechinothrix halophila]|uniref:hypothetical protein n=1 Tax=Haloechinothrix halophila TaxID=1069073 RepID=UPI0004164A8F|nr:hypothetical protein [Haloechinothrix halophila]
MYELSRVRLHSVGPAGARYQDVVLDLSGVGEPVSSPSQEALFSAGVQLDNEQPGPPRRPSPASVLFLENGGGKSVLIKLIFSVMLPGRRQVVGTTNTRVLEKFVGAKDVAHVVLEWQHTRTGQRVITGKVSEWRGHVVSSDPANLLDSWYCFRPSVSLQLDSLPLTEDNRLLTMSAFKDRLDAEYREATEIELFWTRKHHEWTEHLGMMGLDTELFRYQRAMNAGEGEAADAFSFGTDEAFVEFLLRAVLDEQAPADLADVVRNYADSLSQRGELMTERDFVSGAMELLTPLVEAESFATASRSLAETAAREAGEFAAAVIARDGAEKERLGGLSQQVDELRDAERLAEGDLRRRNAMVTELRRVVAGLRLDAAQADSDRLAEQVAEARTTARAWRATSTVLGHMAAARKADATRKLVGNREQRAQPALAAKEEAATALARGLLAIAENAGADAAAAEREADEARAAANEAQRDRDAATRAAAEHGARADSLQTRIDEVNDSVKQAIAAGTLPAGTEVADAERQARAATEDAESALVRAERELERVESELAEAQDTLHGLDQRQSAAATARESAESELATARRRAEALAAEPRLAEVLGVDDVRLDSDLEALRARLAEARAETERAQTELWVAASNDERALAALGSGGLLPAPDDVREALDLLEQHGITAWSGLRFLSTLDAESRKAALRRYPHLVSGVLINDPARLAQAERVLTEATLLPSAVLAVGVTSALTGEAAAGADTTASGAEFIVPPNPALYDEDAAEETRESIAARQARRQEEIARLGERAEADAALEWKLAAWREDYPAGALSTLAERADAATSEHHAAVTAAGEQRATVDRLTERRAELRAEVPGLRDTARKTATDLGTIGELATAAARIGQWTDECASAREAAEQARQEAETAEASATRWRERVAEAQRKADEHKRTASSARAELAEVPGGGSVSTDQPVPEEPVAVLRQSFAAAAAAYAKVEVGNDLRAELDHAEHAEATARAALEALDPDVRMLATKLLDTPDGSDAAAREAAERRAERALQALEMERGDAIGVLASRRAEYEALPAAPSVLDSMERPSSIAYGMDLIASATEEVSSAAREVDELQSARAEAEHALQTAEAAATGFGMLAESLTAVAEGHAGDDVSPYDGDVDTARERAQALTSKLSTAQAAVTDAEKTVRGYVDELVQYAAEKRFEDLSSPVRRQIISVRRDSLPEHAEEWVAALRPRLRTLTGDLDQIERHRSGIVTRLQGMVEGALRVLRAAQRLSRLPDGLGDWSGSEFLRIRFAEPDESQLAEQLGEVVDEAAAAQVRDAKRGKSGKDGKTDGMSLLLRGVRAAVPKGFRIDMLKPDSVLRTERQRVSEIRDVFSGGQQLTAAIILYCTMAALRANDKGRLRDRHSGVLFLDNPIGRASAGYLLELQRAVAEALGVQLIYTTGLFDAGALSEFPLIIRMRNDADLRAGRKYLSVDATIRNHLDELGEEDGVARLSATRVYQRTG